MYSALDNAELPALGFPIRTSPDQSLVSGSPRLFAATHVLHRLSAPRHPPHALSSLVTRSSFGRNATSLVESGPRSRPTSTWTLACSRMLYSISKLSVPSFVCGFQRTSRGRCLEKMLWSWTESNRRRPACKAGALPTELQPRMV